MVPFFTLRSQGFRSRSSLLMFRALITLAAYTKAFRLLMLSLNLA
jgi:hypothetical protein